MSKTTENNEGRTLNFVEALIEEDIRLGTYNGRVHTRFPPEPNGYLHIGHAKSICLNFGLAEKYNGKCNLRFDDTNPEAEDIEYVNSIKEDVLWLGFQWDAELYASDYFQQLYDWAEMLIREGKAYVDDQPATEISRQRTSPTEPGIESPFRHRSVEENMHLFRSMRAGEFPEGSRVLRARIDMNSPNMHMRDPILYRIMYREHHRTGNEWCIYPMYDWAHGQSDFLEGITHSICTLEFEVHRPLYEWFLDQITSDTYRPKQREMARLNLNYTVMSKRKLMKLVKEGYVNGWDDPRMPTISGFRRRGYTPEAIRTFSDRIGVAKRENVIDTAFLEHCLREDLNRRALRVMAVLNPLKVVITNFPEGETDWLDAVNNPEDLSAGTREVPFSREIFIEREDFMEDPPKKFFRLAPGREVRLRYAWFITCDEVVKDASGEITELRCTYDPATRGGDSSDGRKVKATLHWVDAREGIEIEARLYDRLFVRENPEEVGEGEDFTVNLNPDSLKVIKGVAEPSLKEVKPLSLFQFERLGYFNVDPDSSPELPVFNRTVTLKDDWARITTKPT
jgi:glutaminyl-tRNA synthetase